MTSVFLKSEVDQVARSLRIEPAAVRRFRNALFKRATDVSTALESIPERVRASFQDRLRFRWLELERVSESEQDGATKLLYRTTDDSRLVESVILRIGSGRTTLCVSSQIGCAAGCTFCATGYLGLARNLSCDEILDQVLQANRLLAVEPRCIRNVVFMGMGEPFHNEAAVTDAVATLVDPAAFNLEPRRITISTVGIPDAMIRFARRFPAVGLALSLHSAVPEVRERLIPAAHRHALPELERAVRETAEIQNRPPMIEYLMLDGINDSLNDATALIRFLGDLRAHINLVPFNPIEGAPDLQGSDVFRICQFAQALRDAGLIVTVRRSLGGDVDAACGQLALKAQRRGERSRLTRVPQRARADSGLFSQ